MTRRAEQGRRLEGRAVFVSGAASGIGRAVADLLATECCLLTLADIDAERGEAAAADIREKGGDAQFVPMDVRDPATVRRAVEASVERYGSLHGAVNAAGIPMVGKRMHELSDSEFDRNIAINLRGTFLCMREQIRLMLPRGGGSIVNLASSGAVLGVPRASEYCGSKAGVTGLTRAAAADYAREGIRVNAVLPGATRTAMLQQVIDQDPKVEAMVAATLPIDRIADPIEIATTIRWLLSEDASFVTGISLSADGGQAALISAPGDRARP